MPAPVRVNVVLDTRALDELRKALLDSPKQFYAVVNSTILPQAQKRLNDTLNKEPGAVSRPFQFASAKSRRYYFATHEGAYRRTGAVRQWRVILKAFSGQVVEMTFENPTPYAQYVYGPRQTPGHGNTGWVNADAELPAQVEAVLANLSEAWVEVLNEPKAA